MVSTAPTVEPTPFDFEASKQLMTEDHIKNTFLDFRPTIAPRRNKTAPTTTKKARDLASDTTSCGPSSGDEEEPKAHIAPPRPNLEHAVSFSEDSIVDGDKRADAGTSDVESSDFVGELKATPAKNTFRWLPKERFDARGVVKMSFQWLPKKRFEAGVAANKSPAAIANAGDVAQALDSMKDASCYKVVVNKTFFDVVVDSQPSARRSVTAPALSNASSDVVGNVEAGETTYESEAMGQTVSADTAGPEPTTHDRKEWADVFDDEQEALEQTLPLDAGTYHNSLELTATEPVASAPEFDEPLAIQHDTTPSRSHGVIELGAHNFLTSSSPAPGEEVGEPRFLSPTKLPDDADQEKSPHKLDSKLEDRKFDEASGVCTVWWKLQVKDFNSNNKLKVSPDIIVFLDGEAVTVRLNLFPSKESNSTLTFKDSKGTGYALLKNLSAVQKASISCRVSLASGKERAVKETHALAYDLSATQSSHTEVFNFSSAGSGSHVFVKLEFLPAYQ